MANNAPAVRAEIRTITPTEATMLLRKNDSNRPISEKTVKRYAALMAANDWSLNGEAITVNGGTAHSSMGNKGSQPV